MSALSGVRGLLGRLGAPAEQAVVHDSGRPQGSAPTPIAQVRPRTRVRVQGRVSMVTINPRGVNRWLEAVLDDGTGELTLVWMGRRTVRGIEAGRRLEVTGLVAESGATLTVYNPNYCLLPE